MTGRFTFPENNDDAGIMARVDEIEIKLWRRNPDEETNQPAGVCGSFKLTGDIGSLDDAADADDLAFMRKLLSEFERVEK